MHQAQLKFGENLRLEPFVFLHGRCRLNFVRFLHQRANHKRLPPLIHLAAHKIIAPPALTRPYPARLNLLPPRWHLV